MKIRLEARLPAPQTLALSVPRVQVVVRFGARVRVQFGAQLAERFGPRGPDRVACLPPATRDMGWHGAIGRFMEDL